MALDIADGEIQGVSSIVDPDKIWHLGQVRDARAVPAPVMRAATAVAAPRPTVTGP